jgi:hypothetical protein
MTLSEPAACSPISGRRSRVPRPQFQRDRLWELQEGPLREPCVGKGISEQGPTLPHRVRQKTKRPKLGQTFQQASDQSLLGFIVVADDLFRTLTQSQITMDQGTLKTTGSAITACSMPVPRFNESGLVKGRFHLAIYDSTLHAWQETISSLTIQEDSDVAISLKLVPPCKLPKLRRAEVFINGPPASVPEVVIWLQAQNPGLSTERWHLRFRNKTANGQLMVWGIDPNSVTTLDTINNQPFNSLTRVTFEVYMTSLVLGLRLAPDRGLCTGSVSTTKKW